MKLIDLHESKVGNVHIALSKMVSYIERKLGSKLIKIPGVEQYHNSKGTGFGYRYAIDGTLKMLRFNWASKTKAGNAGEIISIDIFSGKKSPSFTVSAKNISLVKTLPALVTILHSPTLGKKKVFPVNPSEALTEELTEAKRDDYTSEQVLDHFFSLLIRGRTMTRSDFITQYHIIHVGIFDTILADFSDQVEINGRRISLGGVHAANLGDPVRLKQLKTEIMTVAGVLEVEVGGTNETYSETKAEAAAQELTNERVSFSDTLEHLEGLVTGVVKGAFNALFVSGKGGTGKTQTVERVLEEFGLSDGNGYYKNTGTASGPGVFTLLYHNRKNIVLFDDCDGALADQDARNIIKAATDTKKKRKLSWNKRSSFIYDPEDKELADELSDDSNMAPKYFDFEGRIIFISNLPLGKLDPDGALRTRAFIINVDPTPDEMFEYMGKILFDIRLEEGLSLTRDERLEVLEVVKTSKRPGDVSLRKLVRALNLAASGAGNWKKLVELYC